MRWLSLVLLGILSVELLVLCLQRMAPVMREVPEVDLTLLGDRVAVQTIATIRENLSVSSASDWKRLGEFYLTYGYYPQSEQCFRTGHELAPQDDELLLLRAISLDRMGAKRSAIDFYRDAIERGVPGAGAFRIRIPHCLLALGEDAAAEKELRAMGDDSQARLVLSRILLRSGREAEALRLLSIVAGEYPNGIEPYAMTAWGAEALGDPAGARGVQLRAQRSQKNIARNVLIREEDLRRRQKYSNHAFHVRSLQLEGAGRVAEARQACQAAIEAMWEEEMVLSFALLELNTGQPHRAITLLEEAIERVGESASTLEALGDALQATGDDDQARRTWLRACAIQASEPLHNKLAQSFSSSGDFDQAQWHRGLASYERGKQAWLENRVPDARQAFEEATNLAPKYPGSWYYLGECLWLRGDAQAAEAAFEKCLQLAPGHGRAFRSRSDLRQAIAANDTDGKG